MINHKKNSNKSQLKTLLDGEFAADNSGKKQDKSVKEGFTKKMRSEIAKDIKKVPGKFERVEYVAKQDGKSLSYNIGKDTDYDEAVKQKLGA